MTMLSKDEVGSLQLALATQLLVLSDMTELKSKMTSNKQIAKEIRNIESIQKKVSRLKHQQIEAW